MYPDNLIVLRVQQELTQKELAQRAGISLTAYRNIESGVSEPRMETLDALATALKVPLRELLSPSQPLKAVRFRAQKKMKCHALVMANVRRWLRDYNDLEKLLQEPQPYAFEALVAELKHIPAGKPRAIKVAERCREILGLEKKEAIRDICGLLESGGIKVYPYKVEADRFFGLSVATQDGGPAIVVNVWDRISVERWIFSSVHELGHLLMHLGSYDVEQKAESVEEEREADQFASHFLMPEPLFLSEWQETRGLSFVEGVLKVKRIFRVSYKTVIYRLIENYGYSKDSWRDFFIGYQRLYKKRLRMADEPNALGAPSFQGTISEAKRSHEPSNLDNWDFVEDHLKSLVRTGIENEAITLSRGAEILGLKMTEMRQVVAAWRG